jgi:hypothetical protein
MHAVDADWSNFTQPVSVSEVFLSGRPNTCAVVNQIIVTIICIAFSGFQANIIQFGMDQLLSSNNLQICNECLLARSQLQAWHVRNSL